MRGAHLSHVMANICQDLLALLGVVVIPIEHSYMENKRKPELTCMLTLLRTSAEHSLLHKSSPTKLHSFSSQTLVLIMHQASGWHVER